MGKLAQHDALTEPSYVSFQLSPFLLTVELAYLSVLCEFMQ